MPKNRILECIEYYQCTPKNGCSIRPICHDGLGRKPGTFCKYYVKVHCLDKMYVECSFVEGSPLDLFE